MRMTPPQSGQMANPAGLGRSRGGPLASVRGPLTIEKLAAKGEFGGALAVGHEAEVADAMEAVGQGVKKEAADELVGGKVHELGLAPCWR